MSNADNLRMLIFLSYITGYNIKDIYILWEQGCKSNINVEALIAEYLYKNVNENYSASAVEKFVYKAEKDTDYALNYLEYQNIRAIPWNSKDYPEILRVLKDPPPVLFVKGKLRHTGMVAVIGTRETSWHAQRITGRIVESLVGEDFGIVSGLAVGVDTFAHQKAIDCDGYTMAVMPNSLDTVYPKENLALANDILKRGGALVSELIFGINRGRKSFVERDRIQAAFSDAVIPIEMGIKSGTMHTVSFTKSQKKFLYLLKPAPIMESLPQYEGILHLIDMQLKNPKPNVFILENMGELREKIVQLRYPPSSQIDMFY